MATLRRKSPLWQRGTRRGEKWWQQHTSVLLEGDANSGWKVVEEGPQTLAGDPTSTSIEARWLEAGNTVILPRTIKANRQKCVFLVFFVTKVAVKCCLDGWCHYVACWAVLQLVVADGLWLWCAHGVLLSLQGQYRQGICRIKVKGRG